MVEIGEAATGGGGSGGGPSSSSNEEDEDDSTIVKVRLHDEWVEPMANAWYLLEAGGEQRRGQADEAGVVVEEFDDPVEECEVSWSPGEDPQPGSKSDFQHTMTVYVTITDSDTRERERKRLNNLGLPFSAGDSEVRDASLQSVKEGWGAREMTPGVLVSVSRRDPLKG